MAKGEAGKEMAKGGTGEQGSEGDLASCEGEHLKGVGWRGKGEQGAEGEVVGAKGERGPVTWAGRMSRSGGGSKISRITRDQDHNQKINKGA